MKEAKKNDDFLLNFPHEMRPLFLDRLSAQLAKMTAQSAMAATLKTTRFA